MTEYQHDSPISRALMPEQQPSEENIAGATLPEERVELPTIPEPGSSDTAQRVGEEVVRKYLELRSSNDDLSPEEATRIANEDSGRISRALEPPQ